MPPHLSLPVAHMPTPAAVCCGGGGRTPTASLGPSEASSFGSPDLARSTGTADMRQVDEVASTVSAGQLELRRLRHRMGAAMLCLGLLMAVMCEGMLMWAMARLWRHGGQHGQCSYCNSVWQEHPMAIVVNFLYYSRFAALALAGLSDDLRMMRCIMGVDLLVVIVTLAMFFASYEKGEFRSQFSVWALQAGTANTVVFAGLTVWTLHCRSAALMQWRMWRTLSIWISVQMCIELSRITAMQLRCSGFCPGWWNVLASLLFLMVFSQPELLHYIQGVLNRIFLAKSAQRAAAGIAGLVGNFSAKCAASEAVSRFRMVRLADLKFEDLADNTPNPALFELSVPARLGSCDAFVSHSWSDEAEAKWAALQKWRSSFVAEKKREPYIWLDKCCIDQNNIDTDLRCLPVFLSGCRKLVVLCGASYLSRLWCIVEIFTFVHMGGSIANLRCIPVLRGGREQEDFESLDDGFEHFDARRCTCYLRHDKERMLGIIHAAYGDLSSFNMAVRGIFEVAGWVNVKSAQDSSPHSSDCADSAV